MISPVTVLQPRPERVTEVIEPRPSGGSAPRAKGTLRVLTAALAPHLSLDAAGELLWTLTSLRLWEDLVIARGWSADRYRTHVTYLAVGAVTK